MYVDFLSIDDKSIYIIKKNNTNKTNITTTDNALLLPLETLTSNTGY